MSQTSPISLRRNVLWNTFGCAFYQGCQWVITVLVVLLSSDYSNSGILALAMSIGNVFFGLATYNMRTYQISDVDNVNSANNYIAMRMVTTLGALLLCGCYAFVTSGPSGTFLSIAAYLLFKSDEAFANVLYGIDQKAQRMDFIGQSQIMRGCCCVLCFSLALYIVDELPLAIMSMVVACMVVSLLFDLRKAGGIAGSLHPYIEMKRLCSLLRSCFPSVCSIVISGLVVTAARQLFFFKYGDSALGIYATVATPSVLIQVLANNLYSPMLVSIANSFASGENKTTARQMINLAFIVLLIGLAVSFGLSLVGEPLLTFVYGAEISEYAYLLFPALIVTTLMAISYLLSDLLIIIRCMRGALLLNATALLVTIITINTLIDRFYMNGINIALIMAYGLSIVVGALVIFAVLNRNDKSLHK